MDRGRRAASSRRRAWLPRLADGTLVPPLPQSASGFPNIPGVTYTGLKSTRYRFNYGPNFYATGIMTIYPPVVSSPMFDNPPNGPIYPSFVPKIDADGNEIAGIRLPDVRVPIRTYSGWSLRSGAWANDGCEGRGQSVAFPTTKAARQASGDPRLSIAERYPNFLDYYYKVSQAINDMVAERFMLRRGCGRGDEPHAQRGIRHGRDQSVDDEAESSECAASRRRHTGFSETAPMAPSRFPLRERDMPSTTCTRRGRRASPRTRGAGDRPATRAPTRAPTGASSVLVTTIATSAGR